MRNGAGSVGWSVPCVDRYSSTQAADGGRDDSGGGVAHGPGFTGVIFAVANGVAVWGKGVILVAYQI